MWKMRSVASISERIAVVVLYDASTPSWKRQIETRIRDLLHGVIRLPLPQVPEGHDLNVGVRSWRRSYRKELGETVGRITNAITDAVAGAETANDTGVEDARIAAGEGCAVHDTGSRGWWQARHTDPARRTRKSSH